MSTPLPRHPRVLVVDDDSSFFHAVDLGLRKKGFTCVWCLDAESALTATRQYQPDLVMMDVHLPDGDGRQLVRSLRAEGYEGRIMVVTGDANAAADARENDDDPDQMVLEKPVSIRALHQYLKQLAQG